MTKRLVESTEGSLALRRMGGISNFVRWRIIDTAAMIDNVLESIGATNEEIF